jgi:hypothetical protein
LNSLLFEYVAAVLRKHVHNPDIDAVKIAYGAIAAHDLSGQPVWVMIVGPPGSGKTMSIEPLQGNIPNFYEIDQLTPKTFISGQIKDPNDTSDVPAGLLHRIGPSGVIAIPDFSTVLSMPTDQRASIFSDFRRIFDGRLRKEFGTRDLQGREWQGRITLLVATTPDVDRYYSMFQSMGERFIMIRIPRPEGKAAALAAMTQDRTTAKAELKDSVGQLFRDLPSIEPEVPLEIRVKIASLTEFVVKARTHIPRDGYKKEIVYVPEAEAPTRLAQQLCQLARGCARLDRRSQVSEDDYALVRRAGLDCIPANRRTILDQVYLGAKLSDVKMPSSTRSYVIEELKTLNLLDGSDLSEDARQLLDESLVTPEKEAA